MWTAKCKCKKTFLIKCVHTIFNHLRYSLGVFVHPVARDEVAFEQTGQPVLKLHFTFTGSLPLILFQYELLLGRSILVKRKDCLADPPPESAEESI